MKLPILVLALTGLLFGLGGHNTHAATTDYGTLGCGADYRPSNNSVPVYPRRAMQRGIEGYIIMGFSVLEDGSTTDIVVVEAEPKAIFVRSATKAVSQMKFPPCIKNGVATKLTNLNIKYDFKTQ